jgi:hypothetical protein
MRVLLRPSTHTYRRLVLSALHVFHDPPLCTRFGIGYRQQLFSTVCESCAYPKEIRWTEHSQCAYCCVSGSANYFVTLTFKPMVESYFLPDSYGYCPNNSALDAGRATHQRCWRYDWVLEFDIVGLFGSISNDLLMKAVSKYTDCTWVLLYVERWLNCTCADARR